MVAQGAIDPYQTKWTLSMEFSLKKDGYLRFCVYYRGVNAVIVVYLYPIRLMDELIDSSGDATVLTTLRAS